MYYILLACNCNGNNVNICINVGGWIRYVQFNKEKMEENNLDIGISKTSCSKYFRLLQLLRNIHSLAIGPRTERHFIYEWSANTAMYFLPVIGNGRSSEQILIQTLKT